MVLVGVIDAAGCTVDDHALRRLLGPKYKTLLGKLTFVHRPFIGPAITAKTYYVTHGKTSQLTLPREVGFALLDGGVVDELLVDLPPGRPTAFNLDIELMANQIVVVDWLMAHKFNPTRLDEGRGCALLDMPPSTGKTITAAALISRVGQRTLFVVLNRKLQLQAARELATVLPDNMVETPCGVEEFRAVYADVVVCVVNTALALAADDFKQFGMVVIDEVHMFCSEARRELFWKINTRVTLGMSGTTSHNRFGFDSIYKKHLGEPVMAVGLPGFRIDAIKYDVRVNAIKYYGSAEQIIGATGYTDFGAMLGQFIADEQRNLLCVRLIKSLLEDTTCKRYIIAFSDRLSHLRVIAGMLGAAVNIFDDNGFVTSMVGGSTTEELDVANDARVVLTTYGFSGTGLNIQHLNSMVLMTPRKNGMLQIAKRITRTGSDVTIPRKIYDIIDANTTISKQFYQRCNAYREMGFTVDKFICRAPDWEVVQKQRAAQPPLD